MTINPDGSVTATNPAGISTYDGSDDAMIGILNLTDQTLNHFLIHGLSAFGGSFGGMDGDGIYQPLGSRALPAEFTPEHNVRLRAGRRNIDGDLRHRRLRRYCRRPGS